MFKKLFNSIKVNKVIQQQKDAYDSLILQFNTQKFKQPELQQEYEAVIQNQLDKLYLVNQAIRKEYTLTDYSTKLKGAGGIVYREKFKELHKLLQLDLDSVPLPKIKYKSNGNLTYIELAIRGSQKLELRTMNKYISKKSNFNIIKDDAFVYKAYMAISATTPGIVYIPKKYILSDTYHISALEALATYFKKDISILI